MLYASYHDTLVGEKHKYGRVMLLQSHHFVFMSALIMCRRDHVQGL